MNDIEVVRASIEAYNSGDLEALVVLAKPDMTIHDPERTGETFHGTEGFTAFSEEWLEQWEDYRIDIDEIHDAGDGAVVVLGTQSGRGKGSGIELSDAINLVFRIDEGKVAEYTIYTRREDALAAAGLSGERSNG